MYADGGGETEEGGGAMVFDIDITSGSEYCPCNYPAFSLSFIPKQPSYICGASAVKVK